MPYNIKSLAENITKCVNDECVDENILRPLAQSLHDFYNQLIHADADEIKTRYAAQDRIYNRYNGFTDAPAVDEIMGKIMDGQTKWGFLKQCSEDLMNYADDYPLLVEPKDLDLSRYVEQCTETSKLYNTVFEKRVLDIIENGDKESVFGSADVNERYVAALNGYEPQRFARDEDVNVRRAVAKTGNCLDVLIGDKDYTVRAEVAKQGYGIDILVHDERKEVRAAVARTGYLLSELLHDESPMVRIEVARHNYGLDTLVNDQHPSVSFLAKQLFMSEYREAGTSFADNRDLMNDFRTLSKDTFLKVNPDEIEGNYKATVYDIANRLSDFFGDTENLLIEMVKESNVPETLAKYSEQLNEAVDCYDLSPVAEHDAREVLKIIGKNDEPLKFLSAIQYDDEPLFDYGEDRKKISVNFLAYMSDRDYLELLLNRTDLVEKHWNGDIDSFRESFFDWDFYVDVDARIDTPVIRPFNINDPATEVVLAYSLCFADDDRIYGEVSLSDFEKGKLIESMNKYMQDKYNETLIGSINSLSCEAMETLADQYKEQHYKSVDISDMIISAKSMDDSAPVYSVKLFDDYYYEALDRIHSCGVDTDFMSEIYIIAEPTDKGVLLSLSEQDEFGGSDNIHVPLTSKENMTLQKVVKQYECERRSEKNKESKHKKTREDIREGDTK